MSEMKSYGYLPPEIERAIAIMQGYQIIHDYRKKVMDTWTPTAEDRKKGGEQVMRERVEADYDPKTPIGANDHLEPYVPIPERNIKIGTAVNYHPVIGRNGFTPTHIASEVWELGNGEKVVKVDGKSGGVSLRALSARTENDG